MIDNLIAYLGAAYIRYLTVHVKDLVGVARVVVVVVTQDHIYILYTMMYRKAYFGGVTRFSKQIVFTFTYNVNQRVQMYWRCNGVTQRCLWKWYT